jgi:hypothetical protein
LHQSASIANKYKNSANISPTQKTKKSSNDESWCSFHITAFLAVVPCSLVDEPAATALYHEDGGCRFF